MGGDCMTLTIVCCGCGRGLDTTGGLVPVLDFVSSTLTGVLFINSDTLMPFESKEEADTYCSAHGWTVEDKDGPNHRCPDCVKAEAAAKPPAPKRRGMYLELPK